MSSGVCRIGDIVTGRCEAHAHNHPRDFTGQWDTSSSGNVTSNGIGIILTGDTGTTDCNHTFQAVGGSSNVNTRGILLQRVGDPVIVIEGGNGTSITGSGNVTST